MLREQTHQLQQLTHSTSFDSSLLSISPVAGPIDLSPGGAGVPSAAGSAVGSLVGGGTPVGFAAAELHDPTDVIHAHPGATGLSGTAHYPLYLAPGSATASGTPGSSTTSPLAATPSPVGVDALLGLDNPPHPLAFLPPHPFQSPLPFHTATSAGHAPALTATIATATVATTPVVASTVSGPPNQPSLYALPEVPHTPVVIEPDHQFLIPQEHSTAANTLLSLGLTQFFLNRNESIIANSGGGGGHHGSGIGVTALPTPGSIIGGQFRVPRTYFFDIETAQPLPLQLDLIYGSDMAPHTWPPPVLTTIPPEVLNRLVDNYFTYVHPNAPLFSIGQFRQWSTRFYEMGPADTIEMAICLTVWALGALVTPPGEFTLPSVATAASRPPRTAEAAASAQQTERDHVALSLFQPALKIIMHHTVWDFRPPLLATCQTLLLAASYFSHIGRPLYNARMVYLASNQLLRLIDAMKE